MQLLREGHVRLLLLRFVLPRPQHSHTRACNPTLNRDCYAKHVRGDVPKHKMSMGIKKKAHKEPTRRSPRQ